MKRWHILVVLLSILLVVGVGLLWLTGGPSRDSARLPDGSFLRLERMIYGKRDSYSPSEGWRDRVQTKLAAVLPKAWTKHWSPTPRGMFGSWYMNATLHTNNDKLHLWMTRRSSVTGALLNTEVYSGEILDEHGCVYRVAQSGGENHGLTSTPAALTGGSAMSSVTWLTFEGFPRHQKQFHLRLYDWNQNLLGEITVPNPAPPPKPAPDMAPQPLPIVKTDGGVSFTLNKVSLRTNYISRDAGPQRYQLPVELVPTFEVRESGIVTHAWEALELELWDSDGNTSAAIFNTPRVVCLCPYQDAWKLVAKFYGSEKSPGASNAVWVIPGLKVPSPGEYTVINSNQTLNGLQIGLIALGGIGETTYSNGVAVGAAVVEIGTQGSTMNTVGGSGKQAVHKLAAAVPHVAMSLGDISENQRLTVRAVDDQGRQVHAEQWNYGYRTNANSGRTPNYFGRSFRSDPNFVMLNLAPDAKTVDLIIVLHTARVKEFIFKPPAPEK